MNSELFEDVASQLIGLLNVEIDKRDAQLDDAQKTIRKLQDDRLTVESRLADAYRDLRATKDAYHRLLIVPIQAVNGKQAKLDAVLELATEHPAWAGEILLLQFPSIDVVGLLGSITELMGSNRKIDAIKLLRALTPHEDGLDGAYIHLKQAKDFVESYGGEVNLNYLKGESK